MLLNHQGLQCGPFAYHFRCMGPCLCAVEHDHSKSHFCNSCDNHPACSMMVFSFVLQDLVGMPILRIYAGLLYCGAKLQVVMGWGAFWEGALVP